jgi:hypothetical protein
MTFVLAPMNGHSHSESAFLKRAKAGSKGIVRSSGQFWPSQSAAASEPLIAVEPAMLISAMAGEPGDPTRSGPARHHALFGGS